MHFLLPLNEIHAKSMSVKKKELFATGFYNRHELIMSNNVNLKPMLIILGHISRIETSPYPRAYVGPYF